MSFFISNKIPMSPNSNPIAILTDEATIAQWNNCKLPADRVSIKNGWILTSSEISTYDWSSVARNHLD